MRRKSEERPGVESFLPAQAFPGEAHGNAIKTIMRAASTQSGPSEVQVGSAFRMFVETLEGGELPKPE